MYVLSLRTNGAAAVRHHDVGRVSFTFLPYEIVMGYLIPPLFISPSLCLIFTLPVSCISFFVSVCLPLGLSYFFPAEMGQMTVPTFIVLFLVHHHRHCHHHHHHHLLVEERLQKMTWLFELCPSKTRDLVG